MSKNFRDRRPYVRPVTKLEVDQSNVTLRWILVCGFIVIAIVAFGIGIYSSLDTELGWQSIEANSGKPNISSQFILMYDFSEAGSEANQLNKQISVQYSKLCEDAYAIFSPDVSEVDLKNVHYVNESVNREISVHPSLYDAFELLERYGNRSIFLAPVYVEYDRLFRSESDPEARDNDPQYSPDVRAYIDEMIGYISDENMICLELLDDNRVILHVDEAYLNYAQENGIEKFIDFGWLHNAFAADYIAQALVDSGFTDGYLASYDGFTRNLDEETQLFRLNLFDLQGTDIYMPAVMEYSGGTAMVSLRNYPLDDLDQWRTYTYADGSTVTNMIDPADGNSKSALNNLVCYSREYGCAELLLKMIPAYLKDSFHAEELDFLKGAGIYSVWFEDGTLYYNENTLNLEMLPDTDGKFYQKVFRE